MKLWLDLETYSETPIKHGTYKYAADSEILLFGYAIDDEEPVVWDVTENDSTPIELELYLSDPSIELWGQNSMFDRNVLEYNGLIERSRERWRDTMIQAYCHGLPGSLDILGTILKLPTDKQKLKIGRKLINLFCKPLPASRKLRRATRLTHPEEWEQFKEYLKGDVVSMRAAHYAMPKFNYPDSKELALWHLDQKINDRGFCVDLELVEGAIATVATEKERLKWKAQELTDGALESATQRDAVLEYVTEQFGIVLGDLKKSTLEVCLADEMVPEYMKELIRVRLQATSTSTSKYVALRNATSIDGRCRGTIQFGGAARTLRAAGRTFQPQNLPSRGLLPDYEIDFGIDAIKELTAGDMFPDVMKLLVSCVRGVLIPSKGKKLVVSDLSNIEGRLSAWLAGEDWKLEAFRQFDAGTGPDLYVLAYARSFACDTKDVTKHQRSIGKVCELMLGYAGGVGAFVTGAAGYGFNLDQLADTIWDTLPEEQVEEATKFHEWCLKNKISTHGLSDKAFITSDVLKRLWRMANYSISGYWKVLENAVIAAITNKGTTHQAGAHIAVRCDGNWLRVRLPSGRFLCYPSPQVNDGTISYLGLNQYTRKWSRIKTFGGKLLENLAQAIARDILYWAQQPAEDAGYEVVLHVHDELVTETEDIKDFTHDGLSAILAAGTSWTKGLPLAAAGEEMYRYRK